MQLTQKEKELLKDLKGQEKLCVEKYSQHAAAANDEQLSQLLNYLGALSRGTLISSRRSTAARFLSPRQGRRLRKMISSRPIRSAKRRKRRTTAISVPTCSPQKSTPPHSMTPASSSSRTNSSERFSTPSSARSRSTARKYMTICPRTICIRDAKRPSLGAVFYISP